MAWAHVQGHSGVSSNAASVSVTVSAVGSGNMLCVGVFALTGSGQITITLTDNQSNTYTGPVDTYFNGGDWTLSTFYKLNVTNGPTSLTANFSPTPTGNVQILVDEFSVLGGTANCTLDGHNLVDWAAGAGTGSNATYAPLGTTQFGDLIWTEAVSVGSSVMTAGTSPLSFTVGVATSGKSTTAWAVQNLPNPATQANWTQATNGEIAIMAMAFSPGPAYTLLSSTASQLGLSAFASVNKIIICSAVPTSYATAVSNTIGYAFNSVGGCFGSPTSSTDGEQITSNAVTNGTVTTNGTPVCWAVIDDANSRLLAIGYATGFAAVTTISGWSLASFTIDVPQH